MKTLIRLIAIATLFAGSSAALAQHNLQLDDGANPRHYSFTEGRTAAALDLFSLPVGGGPLFVIPPVGTPSLVWQTAGNGALTDLTNNFLGTTDNVPVRMVTGGA